MSSQLTDRNTAGVIGEGADKWQVRSAGIAPMEMQEIRDQ